MAEVIRTDIRKDTNKASFVPVEVEKTTDVTQKTQISVIFRYVCEASYIVKEAVNVIYVPCHWFSCFCPFSKVTTNVLDIIIVGSCCACRLIY